MINLYALKSYEESHIAILDPSSQIRSWWNGLTFQEQLMVAERWMDGRDYQRDLKAASLNQETYGTNI